MALRAGAEVFRRVHSQLFQASKAVQLIPGNYLPVHEHVVLSTFWLCLFSSVYSVHLYMKHLLQSTVSPHLFGQCVLGPWFGLQFAVSDSSVQSDCQGVMQSRNHRFISLTCIILLVVVPGDRGTPGCQICTDTVQGPNLVGID